MKLKIVKVKNPKGYHFTNIYFNKPELAQKYVNNLNNQFLLRKTELLQKINSKRKEKLIKFAIPKKYLLTRQNSKYLLWEER